MSNPICPYCGKESFWVPDSAVYGKSYGGFLYLCRPCDAYVGCHKHLNKQPLGTLANKRLRALRKEAHALFDPLWQSQGLSRSYAYAVMAEVLKIPREEAHIAMLDETYCAMLIDYLKNGIPQSKADDILEPSQPNLDYADNALYGAF